MAWTGCMRRRRRPTWTWRGGNQHNVTFSGGGPASVTQTAGTFDRTFATVGTFTYNCAVHPEMVGTVVVEAAAQATPSPAPATPQPAAVAKPPANVAATPAAPVAGGLPTGGGPPLAGDWFQEAFILMVLGGVMAAVGVGALTIAARSEGRRPV